MISNMLLAFSVSTDAMAVAACKGATISKPRMGTAFQLALIFSFVETLAILLGWKLGVHANEFIFAIDHWIVFIILSVLGLKMMIESFREQSNHAIDISKPKYVLLTAIGTSIDSIAVGVSLGIMDVDIWMMALMVAAVTFTMSGLGLVAGHYLGTKIGRYSGMLGGAILCIIGTKILLEHMLI